ncbi:hypothetical protein KKB44_06270 [Candidatus Micrarchaeota archaeon]|nr:hypothetical protein [Candidatus Micrarchaeota archaeon]
MLASKQRILWTIPKDPKFSWILPLDSRNRRSWSVMRDQELVELARKFMEEERICGRKQLSKADIGLYSILIRRKLLNKVEFEGKQRDWKTMSDAELVEFTRKFMEGRKIYERKKLQKLDGGLYEVLRKRGLLDQLEFEEKYRDWKEVSDDGLVKHARKFMEEKGISERTELRKVDLGLYQVLRKRKLLDKIGFEDKRQKHRNWNSMSDEELVAYGKEFMRKRGITGRHELEKADSGLYRVLMIREIMNQLEFEGKHRDWASMSDEEIVEYAKKFMEEREISRRGKLQKADRGLYEILRKKRLLEDVFVDLDQSRRREAILQVVEAMEEFA